MNHFSKTIIAAAALAVAGAAGASTPTAEDLKKLGTTILPWGAEKAGNKDGTIPEYTGGVKAMKDKPKYDYKSGIQYDPYPNDKVLFWIDASNMDKHADKLSPGVMAMLKKSPSTMKLAVYPSRRSISLPQYVIDNSLKNARENRCSTDKGGDALNTSKGCHGGYPFPIVKDAYDVMWNHSVAYFGNRLRDSTSHMVKSTGEVVVVNHIYAYEDSQMYNPNNPNAQTFETMRTEYYGPTRLVGNATTYFDYWDGVRTAYSYQTASRRTRLAPDYAGDMPIATTGGSMLYDQISLFAGTLERFDWKLIGKKEMYIPYNNYAINVPGVAAKECTIEGGVAMANHPNPNCVRWELHRVWHVKGTVKPTHRHVFGSRDYYFDEDTYLAGLGEGYDKGGKLYIVQWTHSRSDYMKDNPMVEASHLNFDLNSGVYHFPIGLKAWDLDKSIPMSTDKVQDFILKPPQ